ncbi:MAG: DUF1672 family protein [Bacillota bacterium]
MNNKFKWMLGGLGLTMLLSGCMKADSTGVDRNKSLYERVQDYKGEGYSLNNGEENDKIAEAHRKEIEQAVKTFFIENYKTEVKVHNLVGNVEGVTVFVESAGPVHFYSFAIVPIDQGTGEVVPERVWSRDDVVEEGIREGLYRILFDEEFKRLENYLEKVASEGEVVGRTVESLQNVGGSGYMTPYYTITSFHGDEAIKPVYDLYMNNPDSRKEELKRAFDEKSVDEEYININIMLFMEDKNASPSEKVLKRVEQDLIVMDGIPHALYTVLINDNRVHKESFEGYKDNSLKTELTPNL